MYPQKERSTLPDSVAYISGLFGPQVARKGQYARGQPRQKKVTVCPEHRVERTRSTRSLYTVPWKNAPWRVHPFAFGDLDWAEHRGVGVDLLVSSSLRGGSRDMDLTNGHLMSSNHPTSNRAGSSGQKRVQIGGGKHQTSNTNNVFPCIAIVCKYCTLQLSPLCASVWAICMLRSRDPDKAVFFPRMLQVSSHF